jgi:hypothetical protein
MGIRTLEAEIVQELRDVTGLKSLRQKDIVEWSTGNVKTEAGELLAHLPKLAINVAYVSTKKQGSRR